MVALGADPCNVICVGTSFFWSWHVAVSSTLIKDWKICFYIRRQCISLSPYVLNLLPVWLKYIHAFYVLKT